MRLPQETKQIMELCKLFHLYELLFGESQGKADEAHGEGGKEPRRKNSERKDAVRAANSESQTDVYEGHAQKVPFRNVLEPVPLAMVDDAPSHALAVFILLRGVCMLLGGNPFVLGGAAFGSIAIGLFAAGAIAVGIMSFGAITLGHVAIGALAAGQYAIGDHAYGWVAVGLSKASGTHAYLISAGINGLRDFLAENVSPYLAGIFQTIANILGS